MKNKRALFIIIASFAVSPLLVFAQTWVGPTATPPGNEVSAPINTSATAQTKSGALTVTGGIITNGLVNSGGESVTGNVGIGTASPFGQLHIYNTSAGDTLRLQYSAGGGGNWAINPFILNISNGGLSFVDRLNSVTPFVISASDNVGIGTVSPGTKLDVAGEIRTNVGGYGNLGYICGGTGTQCLNFDSGWAYLSDTSGNVYGGQGIALGNLWAANEICLVGNCITSWPTGNSGTITGVTAGSNMTGGGTSGNVTVGVSATPTFTTLTDNGNGFFGASSAGPIAIYNTSGSAEGGEIRITANNGTGYYLENYAGTLRGINNGRSSGIWSWDQSGNLILGSSGTASLTAGSINFNASNPYLNASSYMVVPGGAYFSSGTVYFASQLQARGGIHSDAASYLEIDGGTSGNTYFSGNVGIGTNSPTYNLDVKGTAWNNVERINSSGGSVGIDAFVNSSTRSGVLYGDTGGFGLLGSNLNWAVEVPYGTDNVNMPNSVTVGALTDSGTAILDGGSSSNWAALNIGGTSSINASGSIYSYSSMCVGNSSGNCNSSGGVVIGLADGVVSLTTGASYFNGGLVSIGMTGGDQQLNLSGNIHDYSGGTSEGYLYSDGSNFGLLNSNGSWGLYFPHGSQTLVVPSVIETQIYYDSNDTRYYVIPSGTSNMNTINATAFYYTSDERLKTDIQTLSSSDSLAKIMQLTPVSFSWKNPSMGTGENLGLIAQDVEKVFPQLVSTNASTTMKSVEYGNLVAPLISAVQEQQKEIEALQAEVKALEAK